MFDVARLRRRAFPAQLRRDLGDEPAGHRSPPGRRPVHVVVPGEPGRIPGGQVERRGGFRRGRPAREPELDRPGRGRGHGDDQPGAAGPPGDQGRRAAQPGQRRLPERGPAPQRRIRQRNRAEQLARAQHRGPGAGDEAGDRDLADAAARRPYGGRGVQGRGQGGHRAGGQGQAEVAAHGGHVLHLERGQQGLAALAQQRDRGPGGGTGPRAGRPPAGQLGDRAGRRDLQAAGALGQRGPAEAAEVEQPPQPGLRLGEEPGSAARARRRPAARRRQAPAGSR